MWVDLQTNVLSKFFDQRIIGQLVQDLAIQVPNDFCGRGVPLLSQDFRYLLICE
jgi:hypothetical protein